MPETTTTRRLIVVDEDGTQTDAGPATAEQIEASDAEISGTGYICIDEDGDVVPIGQEQGYCGIRSAWVTE